jgi:hypothetical protein
MQVFSKYENAVCHLVCLLAIPLSALSHRTTPVTVGKPREAAVAAIMHALDLWRAYRCTKPLHAVTLCVQEVPAVWSLQSGYDGASFDWILR